MPNEELQCRRCRSAIVVLQDDGFYKCPKCRHLYPREKQTFIQNHIKILTALQAGTKINAPIYASYEASSMNKHTIPLQSNVLVKNSFHAHIPVGMKGRITGYLDGGYEVYFLKPLVSDSFKSVKPSPVHVFMRFGDVIVNDKTSSSHIP